MSAPVPTDHKEASMTDVMKYFGMRPAEFKTEWQKLTDKDKTDLKQWLTELWDMIRDAE